MVFIQPDVTKAAIVCTLENNMETGVCRVLHPDGFPIGKDVQVYCTTYEEFTILKHQGFKVRINEHPSVATMNGVQVEEKQLPVEQTGPSDT